MYIQKKLVCEKRFNKKVYMNLLDNPIDVHISQSLTLYGFVRVLLILYVIFSNGNTNMMCVLIEFKEVVRNIDDYIHQNTYEINKNELHKVFFIDVHFGNMDRNWHNILIQIEANILYIIPFYHEIFPFKI